MSFVLQIQPYVTAYAAAYGIKAVSAVLGQAVLESGCGKSELALKAHNYFGLKYSDKQPNRCPSASGVYYKIGSEQNPDGSYTSSSMKWQKFDDMEKGVKGYFDFLFNARWTDYTALRGVTDPEEYLRIIKDKGYCTSIKYVENVLKVIELYDLTKYDETKYYRVQLGAYKIRDNALKAKEQFDKKGMPCIIKYIDGLYKLQLGAYSKEENAIKKLKSLEDVKGAFITYS